MHNGNTSILWPRRIISGYKSLLCYTQKGQTPIPITNVLGKYDGTGGDKRFHNWGQEANSARYYIDVFSHEGDLVVDYFLGGGTTAEVCKRLNRNFIGIERDPTTFKIAESRLSGALGPEEKGRQHEMELT
jgi:adenine specific DNA methylase Mod